MIYQHLKDRIVWIDGNRVELIIPLEYKTRRTLKKYLPFFAQPFIHFTTVIGDRPLIYCRGMVYNMEILDTFKDYLKETRRYNREKASV